MNRVIQMEKTLQGPANPEAVEGFALRCFDQQQDLPAWLALRQRTFAREKLGVRDWGPADFKQEFAAKPWWNPQHCWVIETDQGAKDGVLPVLSGTTPAIKEALQIVGSVTLAMRKGLESDRAVVHWLMVYPRYRARGLGRWLLGVLEAKAWELGHREVFLETHSAWEAATRLYLASGYEPVATEQE
jgi:GNAT superfamily N-acetyltransferase